MKDINSKVIEKKAYVTPEVTVHGDIEVITQSTNNGPVADVQFPHFTIS